MGKEINYYRGTEYEIDRLIREKNLYDHIIEIKQVQTLPPVFWTYKISTNLTEWPEN